MAQNHEDDDLVASVRQLREELALLLDRRAAEPSIEDVEPVAIDVCSLLVSVLDENPVRDRERIELYPSPPVVVLGDRARLRLGLATLVDTALGCASVGSRISLRVTTSLGRALVSLRGTGRLQHDHWLGLHIVNRIVEAHEGKTAFALLEDVMRFIIELPLSDLGRPLAPLTSILVVDDNVEQVTALGELLRRDDTAIELATSGREALSQIARKPPDILIVDAHLADMNGADVIRRLREHRPDALTVLISGYPPDHPTIANAVATTRSRYVPKPVDVPALLDIVAAAITR